MVKKQTFEQSMQRLEELVARMEQGELGLDEMLQCFEEGVGLVAFCEEKLRVAEQKIEVMTVGTQAEEEA